MSTNAATETLGRDPNCCRCSLWKSTIHICIWGRGSLRAKILELGEAPGVAEEETGKPFTGKAGQLLNRLNEIVGIEKHIYITNPVKCRPPGNRKPSPKELTACLPYLKKEIELIRPKVIVLLGRVAMKSLGLGGDVNAQTKPFWLEPWPDCWVVPTWHPAYCLRAGRESAKELALVLQRAKKLVNRQSEWR